MQSTNSEYGEPWLHATFTFSLSLSLLFRHLFKTLVTGSTVHIKVYLYIKMYNKSKETT